MLGLKCRVLVRVRCIMFLFVLSQSRDSLKSSAWDYYSIYMEDTHGVFLHGCCGFPQGGSVVDDCDCLAVDLLTCSLTPVSTGQCSGPEGSSAVSHPHGIVQRLKVDRVPTFTVRVHTYSCAIILNIWCHILVHILGLLFNNLIIFINNVISWRCEKPWKSNRCPDISVSTSLSLQGQLLSS